MRALDELRPRVLRFAILPALTAALVGGASLYGAAFERPREAPPGLRDSTEAGLLERIALLPEAMRIPAQRLEAVQVRPLRLAPPRPGELPDSRPKERPWTEPLAGRLRALLAARMDIALIPMPAMPLRPAETLAAAATPGRDSPVFGRPEAGKSEVLAAPIETETLTVNATGVLRDPEGRDFILLESRFDEARMVPQGGRYGPFVVELLSDERIRLVDELGKVIEGPPRGVLGRSHQGQRRLTEGRSRLSDRLRPEAKAQPAPPPRARRRSRRGYGRRGRRRRGNDSDDE